MQILAHRGCWKHPDEKNTRKALLNAFHYGLGVETDVRDLNGQLVISHDMPLTGALELETVLSDYAEARQPGVLALNIKSDGLTAALQKMLIEHKVSRYFCFDMSVPDTLPYLRADMSVAARLSEYETPGWLTEQTQTIWLDGFHSLTVSPTSLDKWLSEGKQICLVSPELHGRTPDPLWHSLLTLPDALRHHPDVMLCTDFPIRAARFLL